MSRCGYCKTPLPREYTSGFCSTPCAKRARMNTEERTAAAIADWLAAMNAPDDRIAKIRDDLAAAIRAGKWRATPGDGGKGEG